MSLMNELKAEISRLARKEIKKELEPVKRVNAMQRGLIANLRRDVTELQKEIKQLRKELGQPEPVQQQEEASQKLWILGKGILSMRKRLGLTQAELAQLADVSTQSVVKWEKTEGKVSFRQEATLQKLQEIRSMGKMQARELLSKEGQDQ
jgi:DNA-binding transcriptional regulator YiaG